MYNLLIVESPTKCRTIGKFLGKDYKVLASGGHIVDLPKSKIGVDVQHSFAPEYKTMAGKKEIVDEIKKAAKNAQKIFLATDPDREGEAISWHIAHLLNIDERDECRVVFNEITSQAVREGIKHPRPIDRNLVDAQQARRVLDRLVGYEISPVLWRKVKTGLSAGRVQSPAVKLIVERQRAIDSFVPEEYWLLGVVLMKERKKFTASFYGTAEGKLELKTKKQTEQIISSLEGAEYVVTKYKEGKKKQHAPSPFTTSLLQQEASRKLGFSAKRTMSVAQSLYEGIEINGEGVGLITYIRTDSLRIAAEAITEVREYIGGKYGAEYLPASPNFYKSKKNIQDAHESIRPTSLSREPESVRAFLSADQFKLYKLIFERFVACQMSEAVYKTKSADIAAGKYIFRATASERVFDGFMSVYIEGKDNEEAKEKKQTLPPLAEAGSHASNEIFNLNGSFIKTNKPVLFFNHRIIAGLIFILLNSYKNVLLQSFKRIQKHFRAQTAQPFKEFPRRFSRKDFQFPFQQHISRIQAYIGKHGGDARYFLAVDQGPLNGRRSAVFRQQRGVHVDASQRRQLQNFARKYLSERRRYHKLRRGLSKRRQPLIGFNSFKLVYPQAQFQRALLNRGHIKGPAPPFRTVGLSEHSADFIAGVIQRP